jgi:hypothetical protein
MGPREYVGCETYLGCRLDERKAEERVAPVLEKFLQGDDETPRMRAVDDQSLQQDPDDLLANVRVIVLGVVDAKQTENGEAEEIGVAVGVAELIGHRTEQVVTRLGLKNLGELVQESGVGGVFKRAPGVALGSVLHGGLLADIQYQSIQQNDVHVDWDKEETGLLDFGVENGVAELANGSL